MENFFDSKGRDRIIHDWIKKNKPDFLQLYEHTLSKNGDYKNYNVLFLIAFEAGCEFAKASKGEREAKVEYDYEASYS